MNTFLPYPSFEESAKCLDDLRLRKQLVECDQILNVLAGKTRAWVNHPAVKMWAGYESALKLYRNYILRENQARGFKLNGVTIPYEKNFNLPKWFALDKFHDSHKSKLLWKGKVDALCYALKMYLNVRSINEWFELNGYSQKNVLTREEYSKLKLKFNGLLPVQENHYFAFSKDVPDDLPYFWPTKEGF